MTYADYLQDSPKQVRKVFPAFSEGDQQIRAARRPDLHAYPVERHALRYAQTQVLLDLSERTIRWPGGADKSAAGENLVFEPKLCSGFSLHMF